MTVAEDILLAVSVAVFIYLGIAMFKPEWFWRAGMTDIILIAPIVAFFVAAAVLVRVLDHMIAGSGSGADPGDEASGQGLESGRPR